MAIGGGTVGIFNLLNRAKPLVLVLFLYGCTVKTQITEPDGSIYTVTSKTNSMVVVKSEGREIVVDNRGKSNIFESLLGWLLLKTPEVTQVK